MKKAYLNIRVDTSGSEPIVDWVDVHANSGRNIAAESLDRFWATVDVCEANTFELAEKEILRRLDVAAKKLPSFRVLLELLQKDAWDPDHSDAPGG